MNSFIKNKGKISFTYKDSGLYGNFLNYNRLQAYKHALNKYNISKNLVLDVGCSYGSWFENWKELGFIELYGVDINEEVLDQAHQKYNKVLLGEAKDLKNLFPHKFNMVASNAVLIHILEDEAVSEFCQGISDILADNGYFFVTIVTAEYYNYGKERYSNDNCIRSVKHNLQIIEKGNLEVIDTIGTFIEPWALKDLKWLRREKELREKASFYEPFSNLADCLRMKSNVPFSELLLVCKKKRPLAI